MNNGDTKTPSKRIAATPITGPKNQVNRPEKSDKTVTLAMASRFNGSPITEIQEPHQPVEEQLIARAVLSLRFDERDPSLINGFYRTEMHIEMGVRPYNV